MKNSADPDQTKLIDQDLFYFQRGHFKGQKDRLLLCCMELVELIPNRDIALIFFKIWSFENTCFGQSAEVWKYKVNA